MQTSTFSAELTDLNKAAKECVVLRYHLISMGIKVYKPTSLFVDNINVVLNANNPGITLNKKTVALG